MEPPIFWAQNVHLTAFRATYRVLVCVNTTAEAEKISYGWWLQVFQFGNFSYSNHTRNVRILNWPKTIPFSFSGNEKIKIEQKVLFPVNLKSWHFRCEVGDCETPQSDFKITRIAIFGLREFWNQQNLFGCNPIVTHWLFRVSSLNFLLLIYMSMSIRGKDIPQQGAFIGVELPEACDSL